MAHISTTRVKFFAFVAASFVYLSCSAQIGIYKSVDEFKAGKPSVTGDKITCEMVFGKWSVTLHNGKDKTKFDSKEIWGYRKANTDYRLIAGQPHAVATKGALYVYAGAGDSLQVIGDSVTYQKVGNGYCWVSKGLEQAPHQVHNYKDILKMIEPAKASQIQQLIGKSNKDRKVAGIRVIINQNLLNHGRSSIGPSASIASQFVMLSSFTEDVADYYNSTQPNYQSTRFKAFVYNYANAGNF